ISLAAFVQDLPLPGLAIKVSGDADVQADPDLLAAALLNLLDNSVRYGATQAQVSFRRDADVTVIPLVDNGPGVGEATRKRIGAALATQHYAPDMGLGLMLADRVA
ncbi:ATP-binding protein, partial [Acinetobacter baumannii]|uniref:ATP-binding protein n=1 Tax=Acinetobacter baumannii TaxID=470 RepID=UPI00207B12EB